MDAQFLCIFQINMIVADGPGGNIMDVIFRQSLQKGPIDPALSHNGNPVAAFCHGYIFHRGDF